MTVQSTDEEPITEDEVRDALDRLVALEPDPSDIDTIEEYQAAMAPHAAEIDAAMKTLRLFAEQGQPASLEQMQREYYSFTNDPRYLDKSVTSGVVMTVLRQAWRGIGPWLA